MRENKAPAVVYTPNDRIINIDMGLIGTGNQEVTEDKLNRVGAHGVVVVDKLGKNSKVPAAAVSKDVALIALRSSDPTVAPEPLLRLHRHLQAFFDYPLPRPPQGDAAILASMAALDSDSDYLTLFSRLYRQFAATVKQGVGNEEAAPASVAG